MNRRDFIVNGASALGGMLLPDANSLENRLNDAYKQGMKLKEAAKNLGRRTDPTDLYTQAYDQFAQARKANNKPYESLLGQAECASQILKHDEAVKLSDLAVKEQPKDHRAYALRGFVYRRKGDFKKAIGDCAKSIEIKDTAEARWTKLNAHYSLRQYAEAQKEITQYIKLTPGETDGYISRLFVLDDQLKAFGADKTVLRKKQLETYEKLISLYDQGKRNKKFSGSIESYKKEYARLKAKYNK